MLMTNKFLCRIGMKLLLCFIHEIAAHNWTFPSKFIGGMINILKTFFLLIVYINFVLPCGFCCAMWVPCIIKVFSGVSVNM